MKIRTDFVTNSSSSCFTVEITIRTPYGDVYMEENPYRYDPDSGGTAEFRRDLREINEHLSSVQALATWLADSVKGDIWSDQDSSALRKKKSRFIRDACTKIKTVRDIETISVVRRYSAWGEFADLVADNDRTLNALAEKYLNSSGIEKERAEVEMVTYIQSAVDARGENFGENSIVSRYNWNGKSLKKLAERLCSNYGPGSVSGVERRELNLKTGEYYDTSDFDLS